MGPVTNEQVKLDVVGCVEDRPSQVCGSAGLVLRQLPRENGEDFNGAWVLPESRKTLHAHVRGSWDGGET